MNWRVQRGVAVFGAAGPGPVSYDVPILAGDPARSFPRLTNVRWSGSGRDTAADVLLGMHDLGAVALSWDGTSIPLERNTTAELANHRYHWEAIQDRLSPAAHALDGFEVALFDHWRMAPGETVLASPPTIGGDLSRVAFWPCAMRADSLGQDGADSQWTAYIDGAGVLQAQRSGSVGNATLTGAALRMGSAWTVTRVSGSATNTGLDVAIAGCGAAPWSEKIYVATSRPPAGANNMRDRALVRRDPANADRLLIRVGTTAAAGTYEVSAYVLHNPRLAVLHWDSIASSLPVLGPGVDVDVPLPSPLDASDDQVSVIVHADGAGTTEYPRTHWGYGLDVTQVRFRRGRSGGTRFPDYALQAARWPQEELEGGSGNRAAAKLPSWKAQTVGPLWRAE